LTKDSVLETLLVVLSMIKISAQIFLGISSPSLAKELKLAKNWEELNRNFLNNSEVSSYLSGHILLFRKVTVIKKCPKIQ
jgi:hypothetical protein